MISRVYTYPQTHKCVQLFIFQSYFNKVVKGINLCPVFGRYHKSQAIYLESKDNQKLSCVISSVGANEVGTKLPHPLGKQKVTTCSGRATEKAQWNHGLYMG